MNGITRVTLLVLACLSFSGVVLAEQPPQPKERWREPLTDAPYHSCYDFRPTHWNAISAAPVDADAIRILAAPHKNAIPGEIRASWFQNEGGDVLLCEEVDPGSGTHTQSGCFAWMQEFRRDGDKWEYVGGGGLCRDF